MIPSNDLVQVALDRLAHQYRESPKLQAVVELLVGQVVELRDAILTLEPLRKIDTAEGDGLDGIGEILGQPREVWGLIALDFFGLHDGAGGAAADGFGNLSDATAGLRFRSVNESETQNALLGDAEYRRLLDAKILRNYTRATPEDMIASVQAVLGESTEVVFARTGMAAATLTVQRVLSAEELALLNSDVGIRGEIPVIPRATGVSLTVAGL